MDLIHVLQILRRSACIFQSPVIVPVKDHGYFCPVLCSKDIPAKSCQFFSKLRYLTEYSGILCSCMGDHRTMKFLTAAHTSAELEKLNGICSVRKRLVALCPHLSGTLQ